MAPKQQRCSIKEKREGAQLAIQVGVDEAAYQLGRPRGTVFGWWKQADRLFAFRGNSRSPTLKGQGRKEIFPSVPALVTFMKGTRTDEKALSTHAMIDYMWLLEPEWCASYMDSHKSPEQSLEKMCQRICKR
ncbi:hypothetical protein PHYSODRAFT_515478 [Phytophthora sojae]|uniref:HTH psq-type domain-containing protein n=1 Tax=Phytophthora sojae (strain P6497) TaxID=1094619 RepID=G4ZVV0_PHYSP|nr:hypothetical protein PHYSODRAFT_515478 [Phytophthora sojae]EGZ12286.1 hypothetical protein PHYSODRAFT_515478 [Phytophthora sojae]|eukprot:XP_009532619.1 hypothetical protein PHYSODRAFT_515478 [Phytophthora sojae]